MRLIEGKVVPLLLLGFLCLPCPASVIAAQRFTVADEIGLSLFDEFEPAVRFSPDGSYFTVFSERGRLDLNRPEDSLRFYRSQDVESFLKRSENRPPPSPIWVLNRSTDKEGPIITEWRWLSDSSGVAFLERTTDGIRRLVFADLRNKMIEPLTSPGEAVNAFDVRDQQHYVYTRVDPAPRGKLQDERLAPAIVGTGRSLLELLRPDDSITARIVSSPSHLWAVVDGKRFQVTHDNAPIIPYGNLALSPDGSSLVTKMLVANIPQSWEALYPPPFATDPLRIRAGSTAHQYVLIHLQTGSIRTLTDAPVSSDGGQWAHVWHGGSPVWSSDGQAILLPGTFLSSKEHAPTRPCVAVVNLPSNTRTCVEFLKGHTETGVEEGYHAISDARFVRGDHQRIKVIFLNGDWSIGGSTEYRGTAGGAWQVVAQSNGTPEGGRDGLEVTVKQSFSDPPLLVAANKETSRVIWDPNPQLKDFDLGQVSVYTWKDKEGRDWRGGLFKPSNYKAGFRYPLVIQTHGFLPSGFRPSGQYPTAMAATALAAAGIVVLQVEEQCPSQTPSEGPCAVSGYEAAANQLVSEGLVRRDRIGIIGFSRSCFYVMETLTTSSLHLQAASITDGVMEDYFQYILMPERLASDANPIIGAPPFGEGLELWLKRSPGFNLDKITAPLLVVGEGRASLLFMWQPYAGLRYLHKPVDLIMLNTDEHVLTNPAVRLASQGGSVDWFRFWLQDFEDPGPAKADQYARWRRLRQLQEENEKKLTTRTP